jgi:hypothetical protein
MRKILTLQLITLLLLSLPACTSRKYRQVAEAAVDKFHNQLNRNEFAEIYEESDEVFREKSKKEDVVSYFANTTLKLGKVKSKKLAGSVVKDSPDGRGKLVSLGYTTEYVDGLVATEQFVWRVVDNVATLYQYDVRSSILD